MPRVLCGACLKLVHPTEVIYTVGGWKCLRCVEDSRVAPSSVGRAR